MFGGSVIKTSKLVFATLALTSLAQARNWQLGHEKHASMFFRDSRFNKFLRKRNLWRFEYEEHASTFFAFKP